MNIKDIDTKLIDDIRPIRDDKAHKNNFGHVLICAGSANMTGAASMATGAALRSGAGLVKVFAPTSVLNVIRMQHPCAMTMPMDYSVENQADVCALMRDLKDLTSWADSILIGPGIDSKNNIWAIIIEYFLKNAENVILDASAFDVVNHDIRLYSELMALRSDNNLNPVVMTPHQGEMKRIYNALIQKRLINELETYDSIKALEEVTKALKATIVLKDYKTVISTTESEWYSIEGSNSGMAKGGSGDVLSGLMTGMNAQFENKLNATIAAVYFHTKAGLMAAENLGKRFMLPTDVINHLGQAYKKLDW